MITPTPMTTTDEDGHYCHRRDQGFTSIAIDCRICGDTEDVRICATNEDPPDGCGQVYCAAHLMPYCHGDEVLRIWEAAKAGWRDHKAAHR